jgi:hypothetical protein
VKRNKLIAISAITIAVTVSIAISQGFGRSKILMEIEAYERNEADEQMKAAEKSKAQPIATEPDRPVASGQDFDNKSTVPTVPNTPPIITSTPTVTITPPIITSTPTVTDTPAVVTSSPASADVTQVDNSISDQAECEAEIWRKYGREIKNYGYSDEGSIPEPTPHCKQ